jgi:hypothetical protein
MAIDINGSGTITGISVGGVNDGCIASADLADGAALNSIPNGAMFRNRIINGGMVIDQRNAGASVTPATSQYTLDRWVSSLTQASKFTIQQNAGSVTPPVGFSNYLGVTSSSAYSVLTGDTFLFSQAIEGFNFADMAWGTANAATVTLSFWVRSSLTGTFGGALVNNGATRSYPFSYTISSTNTWEQKSVTIAGDTTGTWVGATNGIGLIVRFGLGSGSTFTSTAGAWAAGNFVQPTGSVSVVGTNGATLYITGVQLEVGSVATPFERRPYGTELAMCQRYYYRITASDTQDALSVAAAAESATVGSVVGSFPVTMRIAPAALEQSGTASDYQIRTGGTSRTLSAVPIYSVLTTESIWRIGTTVASGQTAGLAGVMFSTVAGAYLGWSAEL